VLSRIFGSKRDEVTGNGEDYIKRSFMLVITYYFGDEIKKTGIGRE
jgi:hypothetical protein